MNHGEHAQWGGEEDGMQERSRCCSALNSHRRRRGGLCREDADPETRAFGTVVNETIEKNGWKSSNTKTKSTKVGTGGQRRAHLQYAAALFSVECA